MLSRYVCPWRRRFEEAHVRTPVPSKVAGVHRRAMKLHPGVKLFLVNTYAYFAPNFLLPVFAGVLVLIVGVRNKWAWRKRMNRQAPGGGIYYGGGATEALSCKGEMVYVVGAANSAGQAAMNLARYADQVVILVRGHHSSIST